VRVDPIAERVSTMEQMHSRTFVAVLAALVGLMGVRAELEAQDGGSGRARVIVAPLKTSGGVNHNFGKDVAKKVRKQLESFDLLAPVKDGDVNKLLDQFKLDEEQMDLVSWRQLATRLDAQLIIFGTAAAAAGGVKLDVEFVDAQRGEQMKVPEFTLSGTDADQAAEHIITALDQQVKFLRALANCNDYLSGNQYDDAVRNCDAALAINSESSRARYLRGRVAMKQEQWSQAETFLQPVVKAEPSNEDALQSLAYTEAELGNQQEALKLYQQYLQFNPDNQQIRLSVAYNLASAGAYDQAVQVLQAGIARDSTSAPLWKYLGDVALKKGTEADSSQASSGASISDSMAIQTAIDAYHRYLKLEPDSASTALYRNIVAADLQLGHLEEADRESMEAIQMFPEKDPGLWSLRADVLAHEQHLSEAVAAMDSALAADPHYANAYFKRGLFELRSGDDRGAVADFHKAVDENNQNPNNIATALYGTGFQDYFKQNKFDQAAGMFLAALQFTNDPNLAGQLNFWIGYSYYKAGEAIDSSNKQETCGPARSALARFQKVAAYIHKAGSYQTGSQKSILDGTDTYIYRQSQLVKKACKGG
jgi:tetratricopeptide (TPR) repeat protein